MLHLRISILIGAYISMAIDFNYIFLFSPTLLTVFMDNLLVDKLFLELYLELGIFLLFLLYPLQQVLAYQDQE